MTFSCREFHALFYIKQKGREGTSVGALSFTFCPYLNHPAVEISCLYLKSLSLFCWTGGVLVCATNALLYLNQSVPPYGVSLNSIADHSTDFPLRKRTIFILLKHLVQL